MLLYQYWRAELLYMLTRNTALEGLYSAFLTIRQREKVIRYERIHIRRLPVTRNEYVFLPTGTSVVSPVIAVSKAYKFPRDGLYTIEYTRTINIISPDMQIACNIYAGL